MNLSKFVAALVAATGVFILAACGGGGGGGMMPSAMMPDATPPTTQEAPQVTSSDVQNANPAATITAAAQVASTLPAFGSVTQSARSNGVSQVTTDHATTTFDGESFTLRVDRQDGTRFHLSTDEDYAVAYQYDRSPIRAFPALNSQVDVVKDLENLFEVKQPGALGFTLRGISPLNEIASVPLQYPLGASYPLRVRDFPYEPFRLAVQCFK